MKTYSVAVAGTGFIGPVHIEALRRLGHRVMGVLGSSPHKSLAAAQALAIPKGYAHFAELLADKDVDVVHLATPNKDHFTQCKQALAAGKHVVCEKPLGMTTQETAELVKLAAATPLITAVNYNVRFYPAVLEARERVKSGALGKVIHITGSYMQDWLLWDTDFNWRVLAEQGGALRAVADIGTHWLDTVSFIADAKVMEVFADLQTVHGIRHRPTGPTDTFSNDNSRRETVPVAINTEDAGSILVRFEGGARACVTVSQVMAGRKNAIRFDMAGTKAALAWESEEPNSLHCGYREKANESLIRDPGLLSPTAAKYASYPGGHAEGFPDTFKQLYRAIYADIEHGKSEKPLYATFADGHREVQICEAILESHKRGAWVKV